MIPTCFPPGRLELDGTPADGKEMTNRLLSLVVRARLLP